MSAPSKACTGIDLYATVERPMGPGLGHVAERLVDCSPRVETPAADARDRVKATHLIQGPRRAGKAYLPVTPVALGVMATENG